MTSVLADKRRELAEQAQALAKSLSDDVTANVPLTNYPELLSTKASELAAISTASAEALKQTKAEKSEAVRTITRCLCQRITSYTPLEEYHRWLQSAITDLLRLDFEVGYTGAEAGLVMDDIFKTKNPDNPFGSYIKALGLQ